MLRGRAEGLKMDVPCRPTNITVGLFPVKGSRGTTEAPDKDFFIYREAMLAKLVYKIRSLRAAPRVRKRVTPTRKSNLAPAAAERRSGLWRVELHRGAMSEVEERRRGRSLVLTDGSLGL